MARKTKVVLICDKHRGEVEAEGSVEVEIDGKRRRLDLCAEHMAECARRCVRGCAKPRGVDRHASKRKTSKATAKRRPRRSPDAAEVRAWAIKKGYDLPSAAASRTPCERPTRRSGSPALSRPTTRRSRSRSSSSRCSAHRLSCQAMSSSSIDTDVTAGVSYSWRSHRAMSGADRTWNRLDARRSPVANGPTHAALTHGLVFPLAPTVLRIEDVRQIDGLSRRRVVVGALVPGSPGVVRCVRCGRRGR